MNRLIWSFIFQKSTIAPYKSWKKFPRNCLRKISKEAQFCANFKKLHNSCKKRCHKIFPHKTVFAKYLTCFYENIFLLLLNIRVMHLSRTSAKLRNFCYPLWTIQRYFSTLTYTFIGGIQGQIKKMLFDKLVLIFQGGTQNIKFTKKVEITVLYF